MLEDLDKTIEIGGSHGEEIKSGIFKGYLLHGVGKINKTQFTVTLPKEDDFTVVLDFELPWPRVVPTQRDLVEASSYAITQECAEAILKVSKDILKTGEYPDYDKDDINFDVNYLYTLPRELIADTDFMEETHARIYDTLLEAGTKFSRDEVKAVDFVARYFMRKQFRPFAEEENLKQKENKQEDDLKYKGE